MKFNSQICTTKIQSERLLALGLKKETADMCINLSHELVYSFSYSEALTLYDNYGLSKIMETDLLLPAWSLHRLIEMMPQGIQDYSYRCFALVVNSEGVSYEHHYIDEEGQGYNDSIGCTDLFDNLYDDIIAHIKWLIKEGYFNREYLKE